MKSKVKVYFTLKQATKAQNGIQVQPYSFFNHGSRWGCVVNATPRPLFPRNEPVPILKAAGGPQGQS